MSLEDEEEHPSEVPPKQNREQCCIMEKIINAGLVEPCGAEAFSPPSEIKGADYFFFLSLSVLTPPT